MLIPVFVVPLVGLVLALLTRSRPGLAKRIARVAAWVVVALVVLLLRDYAGAVDAAGSYVAYTSELLGIALGVDGLSLAGLAATSLVCAMVITAPNDRAGLNFDLGVLGILATVGLQLCVRDGLAWAVLAHLVPWLVWPIVGGIAGRRLATCLSIGTVLLSLAIFVVSLEGFNARGGAFEFGFSGLAEIALPAASGSLAFACTILGGWCLAGLWPLDRWYAAGLARADRRQSALISGCIRMLGVVALLRFLPWTPTALLQWTPHLGWLLAGGMLVVGARGLATADRSDPRASLAHLSSLATGLLVFGLATVTVHGMIAAMLGLCGYAWAIAGSHLARPRSAHVVVFAVAAAGVPGIAVGTVSFLILLGAVQFGATAIPAVSVVVAITLISLALGALGWARSCYRQLRADSAGPVHSRWYLLPAVLVSLWLGWWPQWAAVRLAQSAHPTVNNMYLHVCQQLEQPVTRARRLEPEAVESCKNPYPRVQAWARGEP